MAQNKKPRKTVNNYTGEKEKSAEDAGKIIEIVPVDSDDRDGDEYLLKEETSMDALAADEDADAVARKTVTYTENEQIEADFEDRQQLAVGGREALKEELAEYHAESPKLSGGDLDAAWQDANSGGEETVGGTVPTPDQDVVEELGQALGLTYEDDEPISGAEKLRQRDRERWELDPKSAADTPDQAQELDES